MEMMFFHVGQFIAGIFLFFALSFPIGLIAKISGKSQLTYSVNAAIFFGLFWSVGAIVISFNAEFVAQKLDYAYRPAFSYWIQAAMSMAATFFTIKIYKFILKN
jgi:hypothetical protein